MKKLPLLTALAAASICCSAGAQNVTVYGKLYPYLVSEGGSGATAAGTPLSNLVPAAAGVNATGKIKGMSAGNSNLGFRGTEDLGSGLKAIFQIEGTVALDSGAPGFSWNRNTFAGLDGGFGTIKLGLMDTVLKEYGDTLGILGVSSGTPMSSSNVLRRPGFSTSSNSRFHERRPNSIRYDSPDVGGFAVGLQVATSEASLTSNPILGAAKTYSMGVKYDNGPLYLALAYEIHNNWFGGSFGAPAALRNTNAADNITSKDKAWQATVEWRMTKQHKLEFDVIKKNYDENAIVNGRFRSYENTAYMIAVTAVGTTSGAPRHTSSRPPPVRARA